MDIEFFEIDHTYVGFRAAKWVIYELKEAFSFYAPGYKFDKRFQMGYWNGKLSLIKVKEQKFLRGILPKIIAYCEDNGINYNNTIEDTDGPQLTDQQVIDFYKKIGGEHIPHQPQIDAFKLSIKQQRNIILGPTSIGKSYLMHGLNAYYSYKKLKTLLLVDRTQLVNQLKENFIDEYRAKYSVSTIYDDDIDPNANVLISTWQSIYKQDAQWFKQFDVLNYDEVHKAKAKSIISIIEKSGHIKYRHGLTATLDNDSKTDALTLEGLFGKPTQVITNKQAIEDGIITKPIIYAVVLKYSSETRNQLNKLKSQLEDPTDGAKVYQLESKFIESLKPRNDFIKKLHDSLSGNTLIAFKNHEHGEQLFKHIVNKSRDMFFSSYKVPKEKRHDISKQLNNSTKATGVVSFGTFGTGVNIPNLHNLIVGSSLKSAITVPQLIGRLVRNFVGKTHANIFDIGDDLGEGTIYFKHFKIRMQMYLKEGYEIKIKQVSI